MMSKLDRALNDLNELIDNDWEFPDACHKVAARHHVDYYKLVRAYDNQFQEA
jgi:hypothetical protein